MNTPKTYSEVITRPGHAREFYGIVTTRSGHEIYIGPYTNRSTARRNAIKRAEKIRQEEE
jgi:hypothetical protein